MSTTSIKPQSIVHKLIRLAPKRRANTMVGGIESSFTLAQETRILSSRTQECCFTSDKDLSTCSSPLHDQPTAPCNAFETITQNDFVERVLMAASSSTTFLIHFFNDETMFSFDLEEDVNKVLAEDEGSLDDYSCYRINSRLAPYITSKLGIDPSDQASVLLQFSDGQLRGQLRTQPWDLSLEELKKWLDIHQTLETSKS
eukprot:scaffold2557_cov121-Cylindrotheca_fusiformis.AAC.7